MIGLWALKDGTQPFQHIPSEMALELLFSKATPGFYEATCLRMVWYMIQLMNPMVMGLLLILLSLRCVPC